MSRYLGDEVPFTLSSQTWTLLAERVQRAGGDPDDIRLSDAGAEESWRRYRVFLRSGSGRTFGEHSYSIEEAAQSLLAKLVRSNIGPPRPTKSRNAA